jgi:oxygen-independent coproporphyrinogen-3 oxidase
VPASHLYVHVPFCARRCAYCDFSIAVRRDVPVADYIEGIRRELRLRGRTGDRMELDTLYLGGGTPSRLGGAGVSELLAAVREHAHWSDAAEVTLEANPDDVTAEDARRWREAGVNRVSLGAQSFSPRALEWMRRTHDARQIGEAVSHLREAGIAQLSLDLIFALPENVPRDWGDDLDRALELHPDHISLYGLTVEPHTPLGRWTARAEVPPLDDDAYAAEFLVADARLREAGFEHYEVSNAARPGRRARHNSAYWRRAPFIGLGPSAHSGFGATRQWNIRDWSAYERAVAAGAPIVAGEESLDPAALRLEELYLGLRTSDGLPAAAIPAPIAEQWTGAGWATSGDRIRLTPEGWLRLDALVASLP